MDVLAGDDPVYQDNAGSSGVFFSEKGNRPFVQRALLGFASGVMVAASVWSLLIGNGYVLPSGKICFCTGGRRIFSRVAFLLAMDKVIPPSASGKCPAGGPQEPASEDNAPHAGSDAPQFS